MCIIILLYTKRGTCIVSCRQTSIRVLPYLTKMLHQKHHFILLIIIPCIGFVLFKKKVKSEIDFTI